VVDDTEWRIDELAHRSGVAVDTIRFYQREGLLAPARRDGRAGVYGPGHLRQLERIRDLQSRHFSLGAIKVLSEEGRLGLVDTLFAAGSGSYGRDELVAASGLAEELVKRLEDVGLLSFDHGRDTYDNTDLQVLHALRGLLDLGMPDAMVVLLAKLYVEHFDAMQNDVLAVFAGDRADVPRAQVEAFRTRAATEIADILPLVETILNHVHHRAVQRMTLRSIDAGQAAEDAG
jgi:DNA-binding transcriptional MerR regulator